MTHCASLHNQKNNNNLKTKNNQNGQKIELYGSPTTKELKEIHSSRPVGGAEMGSWAERTHGKTVAGGPGRGKVAAGRPSEAVNCGLGGPTFTCR